MFETLRIKLFGRQPYAKIGSKTLERIIRRDFGDHINEVKQKLQGVVEMPHGDKNRVLAAIIKLAARDINAIDNFVEMSNNDFRDVLAKAEYPRCFDLGFGGTRENEMTQTYLADWKDYSNWLSKT